MRTKGLSLFVVTALTLFSFGSCEKELFDQNLYNELVDYQFLIDNIDREHQWCLTHSDTVTILTNNEDIYSVQVLTKNPYTTTGSEIAAEGICFLNDDKTGYSVTLSYTVPLIQEQVFLAAKKSDGSYMGVTTLAFGTDEIDLDRRLLSTAGTLTTPTPQTFTYLYEEGFPLPGDFDFNDLVLRISKSSAQFSYQTDLTVTVDAVGAAKSYAAAILLAGIKYDDVDNVEILEGTAMDEGYPLMHNTINSDKVLLRGRSGEAVIRLFESGHYVMNNQLNSVGSIQTLNYNTEPMETEGKSAKVPSVTRTYRISFKKLATNRNLSFEQIDPFLTQEYNSGLWEIHTYPYKFRETLRSIFDGKWSFYDNHISWAIVVPKADFRYPVEGMSLGTYNSTTGETFGPYTSFAEWMKDQTTNNDWYEHVAYEQLLY